MVGRAYKKTSFLLAVVCSCFSYNGQIWKLLVIISQYSTTKPLVHISHCFSSLSPSSHLPLTSFSHHAPPCSPPSALSWLLYLSEVPWVISEFNMLSALSSPGTLPQAL